MKLPTVFLLFIPLFFSGCNSSNSNENTPQPAAIKHLQPKYAKGFSIDYYTDCKVLNLFQNKDTLHYCLVEKNKTVPKYFEQSTIITTPVTGIICVSTTHIAALVKLGLGEKILGVCQAKFIYNSIIRQQVAEGKIADVGGENSLNIERIIAVKPSFILSYGGDAGAGVSNEKMKALGLKVLLCNDYTEQTPLARAEWLKFIAALFDKETLADSIFNKIDSSYNALKLLANKEADKPTVFCNLPWKEVWYTPGGKSFTATFIADAGARYLWSNDSSTRVLNLNYEAVFNKAVNADYWLHPGGTNSLKELGTIDVKNQLFRAYKTGNVFNNNLLSTPEGAYDYYENGMLEPHIILADLLKIFHPALLPKYSLHYYQQLKRGI